MSNAPEERLAASYCKIEEVSGRGHDSNYYTQCLSDLVLRVCDKSMISICEEIRIFVIIIIAIKGRTITTSRHVCSERRIKYILCVCALISHIQPLIQLFDNQINKLQNLAVIFHPKMRYEMSVFFFVCIELLECNGHALEFMERSQYIRDAFISIFAIEYIFMNYFT